MNSRSYISTVFGAGAVWLMLASNVVAQDPAPSPASADSSADAAAVHDQLRHVRDQILDAWGRRDIDGVLAHVDPAVVVTWQNGEVSRGPDEIRRFYKEMFEGDGSVLSNLESTFNVDDLSVLHGPDTAIAFGSVHDVFTFKRGLTSTTAIGAGHSLSLTSRWTATLVRKSGEWKLASYHVSANVFSNPLQDLAVKAAGRLAAGVGFLAGAVLAFLLTWRFLKRSTTATG